MNLLLLALLAASAPGVTTAPSPSAESVTTAPPPSADWSAAASADFRHVVLLRGAATPDGVRCTWSALRDGVPFAAGRFDLAALRAGGTLTNAMPAVMRAESDRAWRSLRLRFIAPGDPAKGTRERTLAVRQIDRPETSPRPLGPVASGEAPEFGAEGGRWTFETRETFCAFDRASGALVSYRTGRWSRSEWLAAPVAVALPGDLTLKAVDVSEPVSTNGAWEIVVHGCAKGAAVDVAYDVWTRWTVRGDGWIVHVTEMRPMGRRLAGDCGWRFALAAGKPLVECFAKAPYWDRRTLGAEAFDSGEVRAIAYDAGWDHFSVAAGNRPFGLSVRGRSFTLRGEADYLGDVRLAFVIRPEKHFMVSALPPAHFPPTVRRIER